MTDRQRSTPPNFDRIARPYRWLEYTVFGRALERCRLRFLPEVLGARRALLLGDGDGRYLAHLLTRNPHVRVDAVDASAAMLRLLRQRSAADLAAAARVTTHQVDIRSFDPPGRYDLVATHFFLDCLSEPDLREFTTHLQPHLAPEALWVVSEFRIPRGALRWPAAIVVRMLYLAFRLVTGLRTTQLPDYATALRSIGLRVVKQQMSLFGILTSELWQRHPSGAAKHPNLIPALEETQMTTPFPTPPSPVPDVPEPPDTDLPTHPASDPIPDPEPPSPSLAEPDAGVFRRGTTA